MLKHGAPLSHFSLFLQIYCREKSKCAGIHTLSLSLQKASCIRVGSLGTHFRRDSRLLPFQWKPRDELGTRAASSVFAYRYGEITMVRGTLVDIGWRSPVLLSAGERALLFRELSRETATIILSRWNWFAKNLCQRPALPMLIRSYKPIFTLHIGSADWWYNDGKPVRRWWLILADKILVFLRYVMCEQYVDANFL